MAVIGIIFARGGSKTIPNKNLKYLKNNRLIDIALYDLKNSNICDQICISSDSDLILKAGDKINAKKIKRPKDLSLDNSSEIFAWKHAINFLNLSDEDIILVAPTTSPFRSIHTLRKVVEKLQNKNNFDGIVITKSTSMHPNFNIVREINDNVELWDNFNGRISNRQEGENCLDVTTVCFCYKVSSVKKMTNIFDGSISSIKVSIIEGIDIDTLLDLEFAKYLASTGARFLLDLEKDYL